MQVQKVKYALWAAGPPPRHQILPGHLRGRPFLRNGSLERTHPFADPPSGSTAEGEGKRTWTGLSFQCDDLPAAIELVQKNGGGLVREPEEEDGMIHLAFCFDTEGNEIMVTQKRA